MADHDHHDPRHLTPDLPGDDLVGAAIRSLVTDRPGGASVDRIIAGGRRRRQARRRALGSVAAAVLVLVAMTTASLVRDADPFDQSVATEGSVGTSTSAPLRVSDTLVTGLGMVLFPSDGPTMFCQTIGPPLTGSTTECDGGLPLLGVSPDDVSTQAVLGGLASSTRVDVIGTYDGSALSALGPPVPHLGPGWEFNHDGSVEDRPCLDTAGVVGPTSPTGRFEDALGRAAADPDFAATWVSDRANGTIEVFDRQTDWSTTVAVFTFADEDLVTKEAELRAVWDGPLCLASVSFTDDELNTVRDEALALMGFTPIPFGVAFFTNDNTVDLTVRIADEPTTSLLLGQFPAGSVELRPWLRSTTDDPIDIPDGLRDLGPGDVLLVDTDGRTTLGYLRRSDLHTLAHLPVYGRDDRLVGHVEQVGAFVDAATFAPIATEAAPGPDPTTSEP